MESRYTIWNPKDRESFGFQVLNKEAFRETTVQDHSSYFSGSRNVVFLSLSCFFYFPMRPVSSDTRVTEMNYREEWKWLKTQRPNSHFGLFEGPWPPDPTKQETMRKGKREGSCCSTNQLLVVPSGRLKGAEIAPFPKLIQITKRTG